MVSVCHETRDRVTWGNEDEKEKSRKRKLKLVGSLWVLLAGEISGDIISVSRTHFMQSFTRLHPAMLLLFRLNEPN